MHIQMPDQDAVGIGLVQAAKWRRWRMRRQTEGEVRHREAEAWSIFDPAGLPGQLGVLNPAGEDPLNE